MAQVRLYRSQVSGRDVRLRRAIHDVSKESVRHNKSHEMVFDSKSFLHRINLTAEAFRQVPATIETDQSPESC